MNKFAIVSVFALSLILLGCGEKPITDADLAAEYGLSVEEFQEQKQAAARMNMSVEDHLNNGMHNGMADDHMQH